MAGWYPSHMARARRELRENLRLVDIVIEIVDSRIPRISRIPDFDALKGNKASLVALNKSDLADAAATDRWIQHFRMAGAHACAVNASTGDGMDTLISLARQSAKESFTGSKRLRPFRAMAVGIPNVGKSSLLNRLAGRKSARTGDRPGITRGKQWIRVAADLELLDLPGILWPQQSLTEEHNLLCLTGAVPDDAFDPVVASEFLLEWLRAHRPSALFDRYNIDLREAMEPEAVLSSVACRRGFLQSGGSPDATKAAVALLVDFRAARLGRITLELPPESEPLP